MTCQMIDGRAISDQIKEELAAEVSEFRKVTDVKPNLAVVLVGDNPASVIYVEKKQQACAQVGIASRVIDLPADVSFSKLEETIRKLNADHGTHGILVQLPLPFNPHRVYDLIAPIKDVDVFTPYNVGLLVQGRPRYKPCTPHAIQQMLVRSNIPIYGQHVVVINRSDVVGKPLSSMLIQDNDDFANATVTVCHDCTPRSLLLSLTRQADIVVVAVGQPDFLTADMIKSGSVVIDVGINRVGNKVVGDAHVSCREVAGWLSKVPGGVGPLTVACLLENTLQAAKVQLDYQFTNRLGA